MTSLSTIMVVGLLMATCGLAMGRLVWNAEGRPPLSRPRWWTRRREDRPVEGRASKSNPT